MRDITKGASETVPESSEDACLSGVRTAGGRRSRDFFFVSVLPSAIVSIS